MLDNSFPERRNWRQHPPAWDREKQEASVAVIGKKIKGSQYSFEVHLTLDEVFELVDTALSSADLNRIENTTAAGAIAILRNLITLDSDEPDAPAV